MKLTDFYETIIEECTAQSGNFPQLLLYKGTNYILLNLQSTNSSIKLVQNAREENLNRSVLKDF